VSSAPNAKKVQVQFAFFWNTDGNTGCASGDPITDPATVTTPWMTSRLTGHGEGLASLVDSAVHELTETRTDTSTPGAWRDSAGAEIGDKCEWNTGYPGQTLYPVVTFTTGSSWVVQPMWSHKAAINVPVTGWNQQGLSSKGVARGSDGRIDGSNGPNTGLTFQK
jgi:hypothetical protein